MHQQSAVAHDAWQVLWQFIAPTSPRIYPHRTVVCRPTPRFSRWFQRPLLLVVFGSELPSPAFPLVPFAWLPAVDPATILATNYLYSSAAFQKAGFRPMGRRINCLCKQQADSVQRSLPNLREGTRSDAWREVQFLHSGFFCSPSLSPLRCLDNRHCSGRWCLFTRLSWNIFL